MENKIILELDKDSRVKKKELAQKTKKSPQMISYLIKRAESEKIIERYTTNIDPARFGLINLYVFLAYTKFTKEDLRDVKQYLIKEDYVTYIEELSHGVDLLVEYTVPNLSFFNKKYNIFIEQFGKATETISINPVIVKHKFIRNYLVRNSKKQYEYIYSGDRESIMLPKNVRMVLKELKSNPKSRVVDIAKSTNIDVRTILKNIKFLEDKNIIRSFGIDINYKITNIKSALILINTKKFSFNDIKKIISLAKLTPEIVSATKLIGKYGLMLKIESLSDYEEVLDKIRKEINFHEYILYDSRSIAKNTYIPQNILD